MKPNPKWGSYLILKSLENKYNNRTSVIYKTIRINITEAKPMEYEIREAIYENRISFKLEQDPDKKV